MSLHEYTEASGARRIDDFISPIIEELDDFDGAVRMLFGPKLQMVGDEYGTSIDVHCDSGRSDYQLIAVLTLSGCDVFLYVMPSVLDLLAFIRSYAPAMDVLNRPEDTQA